MLESGLGLLGLRFFRGFLGFNVFYVFLITARLREITNRELNIRIAEAQRKKTKKLTKDMGNSKERSTNFQGLDVLRP